MNHVTAALLDLSNIVGGFLLASVLLADLPHVGSWVSRVAVPLAQGSLMVGVLALVTGGYYLIVHLTDGPHVFHFEVVGMGVGVAILRDRLFPSATGARQAGGGHASASGRAHQLFLSARATAVSPAATITSGGLLLAVFGLIAILVGIQGLVTPDS